MREAFKAVTPEELERDILERALSKPYFVQRLDKQTRQAFLTLEQRV